MTAGRAAGPSCGSAMYALSVHALPGKSTSRSRIVSLAMAGFSRLVEIADLSGALFGGGLGHEADGAVAESDLQVFAGQSNHVHVFLLMDLSDHVAGGIGALVDRRVLGEEENLVERFDLGRACGRRFLAGAGSGRCCGGGQLGVENSCRGEFGVTLRLAPGLTAKKVRERHMRLCALGIESDCGAELRFCVGAPAFAAQHVTELQ